MVEKKLLLSLVLIIVISVGAIYFFKIRPEEIIEQEKNDAIKLQVLNEVQKIESLYPTIKLQEENWLDYESSISTGGISANNFTSSNVTAIESAIGTYNDLKINKIIYFDSENIWLIIPYPSTNFIFRWAPTADP
jgi:hypothetical protein